MQLTPFAPLCGRAWVHTSVDGVVGGAEAASGVADVADELHDDVVAGA